MSELKPCPFCGEADTEVMHIHLKTDEEDYWYYFAGCRYCCIGFEDIDRAYVVTKWNTRAGLEVLGGETDHGAMRAPSGPHEALRGLDPLDTYTKEETRGAERISCVGPTRTFSVEVVKSMDATLEKVIAEKEELKAEVERLKGELQQERKDRDRDSISNWRFRVSVESSEPYRLHPWDRVETKITDIGYADRGVILEPEVPLVPASDVVELNAEMERLKAELREAVRCGAWLQGELTEAKGQLVVLKYHHTWKQERAAIVAWLRTHGPKYNFSDQRELVEELSKRVEEGEHWPKVNNG
jgi:hypothetical protein